MDGFSILHIKKNKRFSLLLCYVKFKIIFVFLICMLIYVYTQLFIPIWITVSLFGISCYYYYLISFCSCFKVSVIIHSILRFVNKTRINVFIAVLYCISNWYVWKWNVTLLSKKWSIVFFIVVTFPTLLTQKFLQYQ